jgi:cytoplasmic iron level regulating protein YaaA (DUF328/UPF0246 family)
MRPQERGDAPYQAPSLLNEASLLAAYIKTLTTTEFKSHMHLSPAMAAQTRELFQAWTTDPRRQRPAIDSFLGDIYSGLQVRTFDRADRAYANDHLVILSGLYGGLRALDSVSPYRLEMGYKLPAGDFENLYKFWSDKIAALLPRDRTVVNLSAVEYTKAVLPFVDTPVVTPKFMTVSPKTGEPVFVTVHAKIARGAFAHWMIKHRVDSADHLPEFNELGYQYDIAASTQAEPVYICEQFEGIGLSVRLT